MNVMSALATSLQNIDTYLICAADVVCGRSPRNRTSLYNRVFHAVSALRGGASPALEAVLS